MTRMRKIRNAVLITVLLTLFCGIGAAWAASGDAAPAGGSALAASDVRMVVAENGAVFWAAAITMGSACLAAAYAVGKVGAAALGAAAEKPELLGKAIVFVAIGEGIAIFGLIVSVMILSKI